MLEWIRENKRWAQIILIALVFPFACTGIEGYRRMQADTDTVARVGGQKISRQEYDAAVGEQMERFKQMLGGNVDPKMFDTPQARQAVMDQLVTQHVLLAEVKRERMSMSDVQLHDMIAAIPAFQTEGKFDSTKYQQYLMSQGITGTQFDARARQDIAFQQLTRFAADSAMNPRSATAALLTAYRQERTISTATYTPSDFLAKVEVTDAAINAYYEANKANFETPEHADIEYLVLSPEAVAQSIKVDGGDVAKYYEQNQARYRVAEQRRASHILVAVAPTASDVDKKAARAKAEALLAQVRKSPGDFAKLAKQSSDDPGTRDRGGDLDYFARGAMVKPFDDAVFSMKQGEISGLVQSDFGYHIIQLTGIRPGTAKSLDEVKPEIESEIRQQLAARKAGELAEVFSNTVYEQSDSLKPAADKLGLAIQSMRDFSREGATASKVPGLSNPKFLAALFSDDAIRNKRNTAAVEVSPGTFISGRITNYTARATRSLADVRPLVVEAVKRQEALKLAQAAGAADLAAIRSGKGAGKFGTSLKVSRANPGNLSPDALRMVLRADASKLPQYVGTDVGPQGYAIYRVDAVVAQGSDEAAANQAKSLEQSFAKTIADADSEAVVGAMRARAKVEIVSGGIDAASNK